MRIRIQIFLVACLILVGSAHASVTYRWKGDPSNPVDPSPIARAQDIRFDITFTDSAVNSGSLILAQNESSCIGQPDPCTTYLNGGVSELHFGIGNNGSWTVDTSTRPGALNWYDIDVHFGPTEFLSGAIFAGNFESDFRMSSVGDRFMISVGSDNGNGLIIQQDTVFGVMERVSLPEPSTPALIGLACLTMILIRRSPRTNRTS
jgi:hypothetical protein